jgi:hypothetical protein
LGIGLGAAAPKPPRVTNDRTLKSKLESAFEYSANRASRPASYATLAPRHAR